MGEKEFLKLYMKERELKSLEEAKEKVCPNEAKQ